MSFPASVFYGNNNPDEIKVTAQAPAREVDESRGIFVPTTNTLIQHRVPPVVF